MRRPGATELAIFSGPGISVLLSGVYEWNRVDCRVIKFPAPDIYAASCHTTLSYLHGLQAET